MKKFQSARACGLQLLLSGFLLAGQVALVGAPASQVLLRTEFIYEQAPFPECHASTIVETTAGTLLCSWYGGTMERNPDVGIWLSRHQAGKWTVPVEVANGIQYRKGDGTAVRYPTWNPVLFQSRQGPLLLFYKAGPTAETWWGLLMTSDDDGRTWSEPRRLPEGVLGPIKNKPVQLADGTLFCPSSAENPVSGWAVHFELTRDLGRTWEIIGPINTKDQFNAIQPSVLFHADGRLQVLCRSKESVVATSWSKDLGRTWSRMEASSLPNPNAATDAVTLADGRQVVVYNPTKRKPDGSGGPRTPLVVAISPDGVNWRDILTLEDSPGEFSYPSIIQTKDSLLHITYSWKRERIRHAVLQPPPRI